MMTTSRDARGQRANVARNKDAAAARNIEVDLSIEADRNIEVDQSKEATKRDARGLATVKEAKGAADGAKALTSPVYASEAATWCRCS